MNVLNCTADNPTIIGNNGFNTSLNPLDRKPANSGNLTPDFLNVGTICKSCSTPATNTATATHTMRFSIGYLCVNKTTGNTAAAAVTRFKIIGDAACAVNRSCTVAIAPNNATTQTIKQYGSMIASISAVSALFDVIRPEHASGIKIASPSSVIPPNVKMRKAVVAAASRFAASCPHSFWTRVYTGTKIAVSAPSPNNRRNKFGN